jgi:NAD-dependent deacetylase
MEKIPLELIEKLRIAKIVTALTGAGVSKESGIPTFREAQTGLWQQYDPTELATPEAFQRDPQLVWQWYEWRRGLINQASPNPGHGALAAMEKMVPEFTLITQNVDGFHRLAGSGNLIELHGNIHRNKCFQEDRLVEEIPAGEDVPPRCPHCGGLLRPDVVWFGEQLPKQALEKAFEAARRAEVFFSVGTSGVVYPAAALPVEAKQHGAVLVEINPQETAFSHMADYSLRGFSGDILPELVNQIWGEGV